MKRQTLDKVLAARDGKRPAALVTEMGSGAQSLFIDGERVSGGALAGDVMDAVTDALRADRGRIVEHGDGNFFIQVFNPPKRLIAVGAVHISQAQV